MFRRPLRLDRLVRKIEGRDCPLCHEPELRVWGPSSDWRRKYVVECRGDDGCCTYAGRLSDFVK